MDASRSNRSWAALPTQRWALLHLEAAAALTDDITLMGRVAPGATNGGSRGYICGLNLGFRLARCSFKTPSALLTQPTLTPSQVCARPAGGGARVERAAQRG